MNGKQQEANAPFGRPARFRQAMGVQEELTFIGQVLLSALLCAAASKQYATLLPGGQCCGASCSMNCSKLSTRWYCMRGSSLKYSS